MTDPGVIQLLVEVETKASNERGHTFAKQRRVRDERDAVARKWRPLLNAGVPGILVPDTKLRLPRGVSMKIRKLAKATGTDLRRVEPISRPLGPLVVHLTRISPGALDDDNIRTALKNIRDQVARELGIDDRDPLVKWDYDSPGQEKGPRGYSAVRIEIELRRMPVVQREQPRQGALL